MQNETGLTNKLWRMIRPVELTAKAFELHGLDVFELQELERKWLEETLPHVKGLPWKTTLDKKNNEALQWIDKKKKSFMDDFSKLRITKSYKERSEILDKVEVLDRLKDKYTKYLKDTPNFDWTPDDVHDLKEWGVDKFIRINHERFYD